MNKYYLIKSHDEITWQVMLSQGDGEGNFTDWTMCYCESYKCAQDIQTALEFCERMSEMFEEQESLMETEAKD